MLDLLYGRIAAARRHWYERHPEARRHLRQPVISVGNLSVGGTGKTPLVAQLAKWLLDRGERPAILSRGYKRRNSRDGVTTVSDGAGALVDVDDAGDEPLLLARQLPGAIVCVADDRHVAGAVAEHALRATVHLLDDGFQHLQLGRDFDVLLTTPGEIARGRVIPRGRLREPRDAAARADFVVVVGADRDAARREAWELGISGFSAARRQLTLPHGVAGRVAVAGIANPPQFFAMLGSAGAELATTLPFPDHHRYTAADIRRIQSACTAAGVPAVVTTEKDLVRLQALGTLPFEVVAVPMRLQLDDWSALAGALVSVLDRRRRAA